jgi:WD40 repeat protein
MDKGRILIWTPLDSKEKTRILSQHSGWVDLLSFSPDGRFLASADDDGKLIIWTIEVNKKNGTDKDGVAIT